MTGCAACPGWLLVFDNADAVEDIRAWLPGGPLPPGIPGHVIVTTRRGGFAALGHVMELDVIDLPSAVTLLRTRVPDLPEDVGEEIAGELGRLPLALEQAAAYLDRSAMPPGDYLGLLRQRAADLYAAGPGQRAPRDDRHAVGYHPGADQRREPGRGRAAGPVRLPGPGAHPAGPVHLHAELLPEPLAAAAADQLAFNEVIGTLVDYSLAKRTQAGLQLHRLVQGVIRARHAYTPAARLPGMTHDRRRVGSARKRPAAGGGAGVAAC